MSSEATAGSGRLVTWLCWGHLASLALLVPFGIAAELDRLSSLVPVLIAVGSLLIFFGVTFWRLPNKPKLPCRVAAPIALAVAFYLGSYASSFAQQDACWTSLLGVPFGARKYMLALLDIQSVRYVLALVGLVAVYLCAANVARPLTFAYLLFFLAFCGVLLGMIVNLPHFPRVISSPFGHVLHIDRVDMLGENPNGTGALLVLYGALGYALIGPTRQRALKALLIAALGVLAACLVLTFSRGAWLGLAVMIAAAPALSRRSDWWKLTGGVLAISAVLFWLFSLLHVRSAPELGLVVRLRLWEDGLRVFATHPLFGTGVETQLIQNPDSRALTHAHNAFVNLLADSGIVGTFLILWATAASCRMVWQIASAAQDKLLRAQALGLLLGLVGLATSDLLGVGWRRETVRLFVTLLLAGVLGAAGSGRAGALGRNARNQDTLGLGARTERRSMDLT